MNADEKRIRAAERLATLKELHEQGYNSPQAMWTAAEAAVKESGDGDFVVTRAQLGDPLWCAANNAKRQEARRAGKLKIVD